MNPKDGHRPRRRRWLHAGALLATILATTDFAPAASATGTGAIAASFTIGFSAALQ